MVTHTVPCVLCRSYICHAATGSRQTGRKEVECQAPLALLSSVRKRLSSRNGMLHTHCCVRAYASASSILLVSSNGLECAPEVPAQRR